LYIPPAVIQELKIGSRDYESVFVHFDPVKQDDSADFVSPVVDEKNIIKKAINEPVMHYLAKYRIFKSKEFH